MFIIFGSPRSGTTICAQTLSAHPDVMIPKETDFIVPMVFIYTRIPDQSMGKEMITRLIINSRAYKDSIGEYIHPGKIQELVESSHYHPSSILGSIYNQIAAHTNARIAGDKSPNDLDYIKILVESESISGIKVIHLVRDVRDLMVSLNRTGWLQDADDYFPRLWSNNNLYLYHKYRHKYEEYLLVRYEDMVKNPRTTFADICKFLEVDFSADILSPDMRPLRFQDRTNLKKPIYTDRVGVYKSNLTTPTLVKYEQQAGEAMRVFGYNLETNEKPGRSWKERLSSIFR